MSLFQRPLQPPAILSDQAVERYLEAVRAEVSVDPLFRRRLRGTVLNRFVAEREGRTATRPRRRMGTLGRGVLYASFVLGISVSSAMAASQGAAPGDALYALKLRIETLRVQALPAHLHDDLAAHALGERVFELHVLAERRDWDGVARHAVAVQASYAAYLAAEGPGPAGGRIAVVAALLERLQDRAQSAILDVVAGVTPARERPPSNRDDGSAVNGASSGSGQGRGQTSAGARQGGGSSEGGGQVPAAGGAWPSGRDPAVDRDPRSPGAEPSPRESATATPKPHPGPRSPKPSERRTDPAASSANPKAGN